jgi:poly(3-hydroxybutyrate) depolymerase
MTIKIQSTATVALTAILALGLAASTSFAQPRGSFGLDSRAESRSYHFADTDEDLPYCVYVSSKVKPDQPAPLIIALHGMGAPPDIMCNSTTVDLAEEGGYIVAAPMGYNTTGWFGSPVISMGGGRGAPPGAAGRGPGGGGNAPENLDELSEKDVLNVLAMMEDEFNIDQGRIYLTGHSMGGAGTYFLGAEHADIWAAIAPVAPAAMMMTGNRAELLQKIADADVPVMVVHGADDEVVSVSISRDDWVPTIDELGIEHEYVELPGITHGPVITASQQDIFRFFGEHSK